MKIRMLTLTAITLLAGACARGGEADRDAALMDTTTTGITITGDSAPAMVAAPTDSAAVVDSAAAGHDGHTTDSTAAPEAHADSAAHD